MKPTAATIDDAPVDIHQVLKVSHAELTDKGIKPQNEDAVGFYIPDDDELLAVKGAVAVVADGVSTAEAGKEASETCVRDFIKDYFRTPELWSTPTSGQRILTALNRHLYHKGHEFHHDSKGFITTLSILILKSNQAHIFHIGDSRIHLLRDEELTQLTIDHASDEGSDRPYLTRAMGMAPGLKIDYKCIDVEEGDLFLLTSDGVHDFLSKDELLRQLLGAGNDLFHTCQDLQEVALQETEFAGKSNDNISSVLVRVDQLPTADKFESVERLCRLPFPPDLEPGQILDGYRVEKLFFASPRSQLYIVTDLETGKELVMKTPSVNYSDDPAYIERFLTEAWVGSRLHHKNLVDFVPARPGHQFLFYLMEYVEGITLEQWMEKNPRPRPKLVMKIVSQIAAGLQALHKKETVHQDLKPGNIMIMPDGTVKIIDLGSVYVPGIAEIYTPIKKEAVLGTVNYTDPLYMQGKNPGAKGDVYSLASITYEMLTGKLPYGNKLENFSAHLDTKRLRYINSGRINPDIPIWLDGAIKKATSFDLDYRYSTVAEFIKDLLEPNPYFLTQEYVAQEGFPVHVIWKFLAYLWLASVGLAIFVFILR